MSETDPTRIGPDCYIDFQEEVITYKGQKYYRDGVVYGVLRFKLDRRSPDQLSLLDASLFDETA